MGSNLFPSSFTYLVNFLQEEERKKLSLIYKVKYEKKVVLKAQFVAALWQYQP